MQNRTLLMLCMHIFCKLYKEKIVNRKATITHQSNTVEIKMKENALGNVGMLNFG